MALGEQRQHIFYILPRLVSPRACLVGVSLASHSSLTGRAGIAPGFMEEDNEAQKGQGFSKGHTVKGGPGGPEPSRGPGPTSSPLPPPCIRSSCQKHQASGVWLRLVALGPQELEITLPTFPPAKPVHWPLLPGHC